LCSSYQWRLRSDMQSLPETNRSWWRSKTRMPLGLAMKRSGANRPRSCWPLPKAALVRSWAAALDKGWRP
ncbi:hypothetical protein SK128_021966, partial [Halocaridina rubra]